MTTPPDPFAAPGDQQPATTPGWGQPGYSAMPPAPPPYGVAGPAPRNGLGTAALILGILALLGAVTVVFGVLFGIIAIILGALGRGRVRSGVATNRSSATAGLVLGGIGLLLSIVLVAVGVSLVTGHRGKTLRDCLDKAGSSTTAQQACERQFTDTFRH